MHKSIRKLKQENGLMLQLMQQLEQTKLELLQALAELEKTSKKVELLNEAKLKLEKEKIEKDYEIRQYLARTDRDYKENTAKNDDKRTEIELLQLSDGNPHNDVIRKIH